MLSIARVTEAATPVIPVEGGLTDLVDKLYTGRGV